MKFNNCQSGSIWELTAYFYKYRRRLLYGFFLLIVANSMGISIPWLIKNAIEGLRSGQDLEVIRWFALIITIAALFQGVVRIVSRHLFLGVSRGIEFDIRTELFRGLQLQSVSFFQKTTIGDIMSRATNDLNAVRMVLGPGVTHGLNSFIIYLFAVSVMLAISFQLTFLAVILFPIWIIGMRRFFVQMNEVSRYSQESLSEISTHIHENLTGSMVVKLFVQEGNERKHFGRLNDEYIKWTLQHARLRAFIFSLMTALGGIGVLIILYVGGQGVIAGQITLGAFVAFTSYLAMLLWPTIALGWIIGLFQQGKASWERISWLLNQKSDIREDSVCQASIVKGEIRVENLSFAYEDGTNVLNRLNLRIEPGEKVALVGGVGSGKSTLIQLFTGFLQAPRGAIYFDGVDMNDYSHEAIRRSIALVSQEPFLFSRTVYDNVAFGGDSPGFPAVRAATDMAYFTAEVEQFPEGFQEVLGERGLTLSTGQRQRTTIARGIVDKHKILLLDDVLASLDAKTGRGILEEIREWGKDLTLLFISHNLAVAQQADRILVIDQGQIVEEGTHDELVHHDGCYAQMHKHQRLMAELETL